MTEGETISVYKLTGTIRDIRKTQLTTIQTFNSNLKLIEFFKGERNYSKIPFKIFFDHDLKEITFKMEQPWKIPVALTYNIDRIIASYGILQLSNDINIRHACLDEIILWFDKFIMRLVNLENILNADEYISIFSVWDYVYGLLNCNGLVELGISLNESRNNINEISKHISNVLLSVPKPNLLLNKDGIPHITVEPYTNIIIVSNKSALKAKVYSSYNVCWPTINLNEERVYLYNDLVTSGTSPYVYYEILWSNGLKPRLLANQIISQNFYDHFNYTHFHQFSNEIEFEFYLYEKIFKSWNSRLDNLPLEYDRIYHGVISNLDLWLEYNNELDMEYYNNLVVRFKCLHVLQGLFPILYNQVMNYRDFLAHVVTLLEDPNIRNYLLNLWTRSDLNFNKFPMLIDMYDFLQRQPMKNQFRLQHACVLDVDVNIVSYIASQDIIHYKFKINLIGYPIYPKPNDLQIMNYLTENKHPKFRFNVYANDISTVYKIKFGEVYNVESVSDVDFLETVKKEFKYREIYKTAFKKALEPENLLISTGYKDSAYKFTTMDKIIMQSYCYQENVSYIDVSQTGADVNVVYGTLNDDYNSSTLKLLQIFLNVALEATKGWEFLTSPLNILILGGINEPLVKVLRRLSNNQYNITVIGRNAFNPYDRADIENIIMNKNFHFIISDIDQTDSGTVDQISEKFVTQLMKFDGLASIACIFKCNYLLEDIYVKINEIYSIRPLYKYQLMKPSASTIGSYEIFFCGFGNRLAGIMMDIQDAKKYKDLSVIQEEYAEPYLYTHLKSIPKLLNSFNVNDGENFFRDAGTIFSVLCKQDELKSCLGIMLSISTKVTYGNTQYRSTESMVRVSGITNFARITFTKLVGNFGAIQDTNFIASGGFYPVNDNLQIQTASPGKCFGFGQRLRLMLLLMEDSLALPTSIFNIIDIGCRDYESIIVANAFPNIKAYVGYDIIPNNILFPITSRVKFINSKVTINNLNDFILNRKETLILAYNSLFMSFTSKQDLIDSLTQIFTTIANIINSESSKSSFLALTLYICEEELIDEYRSIGKVNVEADGIYFTLDQGDPVATLTMNEFKEVRQKSGLQDIDVSFFTVTKELCCVGTALHGMAPNVKTLAVNYLYNMVQPAILIAY